MKTPHSASGPLPLHILVALATIIAVAIPANLAALGSREPPVPANEGSIRQAVAPPYNAPAESADTARLSLPGLVPASLGPATDGAFTGPPNTTGELVLDIDQAVSLALTNNVGLASSRIDTAAKERKVDTAWNVFIPTVDVSGTMARMNVQSTTAGFAPVPGGAAPAGLYDWFTSYSVEIPRWSASGSLSAQLMLNVALFEGMKNLQLDYEAGLITYAQARVQLERDVRKAYYSILLLQENVLLMEENVAAAERRADQAQANYQAGIVPELSLLQARVAAANLKPALEELRNAVTSSLAGFAMNLGLPRDTAIVLAGAPEPVFIHLDADKLTGSVASGRLEVRSMLKSLELIESARKLTALQLYSPSLILGLNFDPTFQGDPLEDSWFMDEGWKQRSGMFRATLSYRLNGLLPLTKEAQALVELDESREKLRIALAQSIRGMETEVDSIVLRLDKARRSIDALQLNVQLAERAYFLAEEAYRSGAKDLLDVQNSELELRKARNEVLKEKFNYMTGLLDLEYAMGVPFGTFERNT
ncbi:MAG: TolC family protein [Clostridia bacterium]